MAKLAAQPPLNRGWAMGDIGRVRHVYDVLALDGSAYPKRATVPQPPPEPVPEPEPSPQPPSDTAR